MQPNTINQQMGQVAQMNPINAQVPQMQPMMPVNQMSQVNPMSQMGPMGQMPQVAQAPQVPAMNQIPPVGMYGAQMPHQGPRPMQRRRKSALQYQNGPMANALSPPVTPGAMHSPYMSITDNSAPYSFDVKPTVVTNTASPQGYEDIKLPRFNSKCQEGTSRRTGHFL